MNQTKLPEIKQYRGKEGLMEVTLHSLNAKGLIRIYEIKTMAEFIPYEKAETIRKEFLKRKIKIHQLTNHAYLEKWTEIDEFAKECMEIRYVDPKKFTIETETLIYNDMVAFYHFNQEVFCVEIENKRLAKMQKQIFDYIWEQAELPIIGKGGRTSIF